MPTSHGPGSRISRRRSPGAGCQLVRVSFAGELGWELHSKVEDTPTVFDAVWAAGQTHGLKPFGMFALDSLRLEKGYRAWKAICRPTTLYCRAGSNASCDWDKPDFLGKAALLTEKQRGVDKRFVTLIVDAGDCDAPYMSTLWHGGRIVGETTSGGWGHRVDRSIALGMLARRSGRARHGARGRDLRRALSGDRAGGSAAVGPRRTNGLRS